MRLLLLLVALFLVTIGCETAKTQKSSLTQYIPRKAALIIKVTDIDDLRSAIANNDFLQELTPTSPYQALQEQYKQFSDIKLTDETLFCFTQLGQNNFELSIITEMSGSLLKGDSLLLKENAAQKGVIKSLNTSIHYIVHNTTFIASTSRILLENVVREDAAAREDALFDRAYETASTSSTATIFVKGTEGKELYKRLFPRAEANLLEESFSWLAADVDLDHNDVRLNGVALVQDSIGLRLSLLKNTNPVPNRIASITPLSAHRVEAISYDEWEQYKNNKANHLKIDPSKYKIALEDVFSTIDELGIIHLPKGKVIVAFSTDVLSTTQALAGNTAGSFRKVPLYTFTEGTAFTKAYAPLLTFPPVKKYAVVEDFFLFGENQEVLETVIANYQNNATLEKSSLYQNTSTQLSSASSYLNITNLSDDHYKTLTDTKEQKNLKNVALEGYHYAATQLIQEREYLLYNTVVLKNDEAASGGGIAQIANIKLNADIQMPPQLVRNHRTNGMDIITQDITNTLYLISNVGKVIWQKELDGPIIGEVQQVDLYRNGRLQLAFTTPSSFYILDRTGKEVAPYPLSFKDRITQPLAIFDYDANNNYRFVIVQDTEVLMYDKKAKPVTGFTFTKAGSSILFPPAHVRISNKDYIVIAALNGDLHILNRTGKTRIPVTKPINFGNTPVFKNGNTFETYTVNGEKISINSGGILKQSISSFDSNAKIAITPKLVVGQQENTLIINGKKKEIAFGSYTRPVINNTGKATYISLTNIASSEVFIYDSKGDLLPNFPVYGISRPSVGFLERNKSLGFVTQGDAKSILIYKIN